MPVLRERPAFDLDLILVEDGLHCECSPGAPLAPRTVADGDAHRFATCHVAYCAADTSTFMLCRHRSFLVEGRTLIRFVR